MKKILCLLLALLVPAIWLCAQGQGGGKRETTVIRGKKMGFTSVSPALEKDIEAKTGKKPAPDPNSKGPNAHVGKHGFAYQFAEKWQLTKKAAFKSGACGLRTRPPSPFGPFPMGLGASCRGGGTVRAAVHALAPTSLVIRIKL